MNFTRSLFLAASLLLIASGATAHNGDAEQPFTVEYYYKIKWGYEDEWLDLYKKNHWPIMLEEMKTGDIVDIRIDSPRNRGPESHRWDLRVTITFRNILIPHGMVARNREPIINRLYPDRELYEAEERRRFQLLDGLMTVEIDSVDTDGLAQKTAPGKAPQRRSQLGPSPSSLPMAALPQVAPGCPSGPETGPQY